MEAFHDTWTGDRHAKQPLQSRPLERQTRKTPGRSRPNGSRTGIPGNATLQSTLHVSQTSLTGRGEDFARVKRGTCDAKHRRKPRDACSVKVKRDGSTILIGCQMSAGTGFEAGPQQHDGFTRPPSPMEAALVWPFGRKAF